jgi:hypothetical protein
MASEDRPPHVHVANRRFARDSEAKEVPWFRGVGYPKRLSWSLRGFVSEYSRCKYGIVLL